LDKSDPFKYKAFKFHMHNQTYSVYLRSTLK
jgi:hypothetical protein